MHHGVIGEDDDATTCAFSRGCCEVNGTAVAKCKMPSNWKISVT
jgi:hypothetical protein